MALWLHPADRRAFGCLLVLAAMYAAMALLSHRVLHSRHVTPLPANAPPDRFSEARAVEHVRYLSAEIDGRQEGRPGLKEAARYIRSELEKIATRAGPGFRVMIEETLVDGSFNMMFLRHSISLGYRNHTNLIMRVEAAETVDADSFLLVNGHFDGPLGSPAAGDCASCVASMLEVARLMIDSNWIPPHPVIFLFNGAEELFLLGSHGFMTTHELAHKIGAVINIEASGTGGPDLVCQSGPGSWPAHVYAESAVFPMAQSAAQDIFGIIPGDTDYRIFTHDWGDIPGLDIIFVLGGYFYHTSYDTVDRLLPGSMQARGDNLFSLIKGFTNSLTLRSIKESSLAMGENGDDTDKAVYFDYLSWFMIFYSRKVAMAIHSVPILLFSLIPIVLHFPKLTTRLWLATFLDFMKGVVFHALGIILAAVISVIFAVSRLFFAGYAMSWFANPYLAYAMFVPCSIAGLLIPTTVAGFFSISQDVKSIRRTREEVCEVARFWGAFGFHALITVAYLVAGLSGGFLAFMLSVSMFIAWIFFSLASKCFGRLSLKSLAGYVIPLVPIILYSVYFTGFLVQFLIEKMGMMGALPQPYGYFVPDVLVAAVVGLMTGFCVGPLVPVAGLWLARLSIVKFLLQVTVIALAISSQFFPYSISAPKRIVLQHTFMTTDANTIVNCSYDFSVVDANSLQFLFKHAPDAAKTLQIHSNLSIENALHSDQSSWVALFPVSSLFSGSLKFPTRADKLLPQYRSMPQLFLTELVKASEFGSRKIHLELNLGSLQEVWVAVLNITGPLSNWSFSDNRIPAPEKIVGGPQSHICRLSGRSDQNWSFWLEANTSDALRVDVAVLDQYLLDDTSRLKNLFPTWADITAFTTFISSYYF